MEANKDCIIEVGHTSRGFQSVEVSWSNIVWRWLMPFGGRALVKEVFDSLLKTSKAEVKDKTGTAFFEVKKGQSLVMKRGGK